MTPVMTSTKTDKSEIDLAGVEAGEKMFVPWGDETCGSLAHTAIADQNRSSIVCVRRRNIEDFVSNIGISVLSFTPEMTPSPDFAIPP